MTTLQPKQSRMAAKPNDPWISVSLLAEHVYCARAAVIQHETNEEDTGEEVDRFRLGWGTPPTFYSFAQLHRELRRIQRHLLWSGIAAIIGVALSSQWRLAWLLVFGVGAVFIAFLIRWLNVFFLQYLPAKWARATVPDVNHTESQPIQWWSLINAGFQPVRPNEGYRDENWRLVGCPWRILVKGDLRIPVFKKRARRTGDDRLFSQHYARMAAYCHLLERSEGGNSPYGVVLFGNTLKGMTTPNHPRYKKIFHDALVNTRLTISRLPLVPSIPTNYQTHCLNCPHSWRDRVTGQSVCGTRFGWTPPNTRDYRY